MPRILLIDDDVYITKYLARFLDAQGHEVRAVTDAVQAPTVAADFIPDVALLDLSMPGRNGLDLLPQLKSLCPRCEFVIYTAFGDVPKAVQAMKLGAFEFLQKPLDDEALLMCLERALEVRHLRHEVTFLREAYDTHGGPGAILVFSDKSRDLLRLAERYRRIRDVPVLIEGESGTGKDLIARFIHHDESNYSRPFVAINCGAIPRSLVEAELFGYAPGAFTGARAEGAPGKIETADSGTLFLDEIGELDPNSQAKLLRFLENGTFYPVGSHIEKHVSARIVSATNRRLADAVANGEFRRDLYYRINVGILRTIPLRERPEEIIPFARHFLDAFGERFGNPFHRIDPAARRILLQAPWPGNVRELSNAIERIALIEEGPVLKPKHVAYLVVDDDSRASTRPAGEPAEAPLPEEGLDLEQTMLRIIQRALQMHDYNQSRTARYLGITREALRYRIRKLEAQQTAH